ncbi:MAG: serine O-acetyltransferase, partial [Clostridia bacterium]|nr:serine O-acetyltransferase [Clostridia bacterium]
FTVGDNSKIAAGSVVLEDIPPNCTAVGSPARIVKRDGVRTDNFDNVHIPDPISQEICKLRIQMDRIAKECADIKNNDAKTQENE